MAASARGRACAARVGQCGLQGSPAPGERTQDAASPAAAVVTCVAERRAWQRLTVSRQCSHSAASYPGEPGRLSLTLAHAARSSAMAAASSSCGLFMFGIILQLPDYSPPAGCRVRVSPVPALFTAAGGADGRARVRVSVRGAAQARERRPLLGLHANASRIVAQFGPAALAGLAQLTEDRHIVRASGCCSHHAGPLRPRCPTVDPCRLRAYCVGRGELPRAFGMLPHGRARHGLRSPPVRRDGHRGSRGFGGGRWRRCMRGRTGRSLGG